MAKRVAIMQPYFFPYLGYFSLIAATDKWVFFDTAQYIRHGWINRNRILKPTKDDLQYIIAPLEKHPRETPINKVVLRADGWQLKVLGQLEHYRKKARYYEDVRGLIQSIFTTELAQQSLVQLNAIAVGRICDYCSIPYDGAVLSEMDITIGEVEAPDEWALEIAKALGATTYVNPMGGMEFFDKDKYRQAGITLQFLRNRLAPYPQPNNEFIPGLSIIDALMFCSPEEVREMVNNYELC